MKYSPSIEVVMSLAVNEALAGMFHEVEVEHLLMGILKYSEMDVEVLRNVVNLGPVLGLMQEELAEIRDLLAGRGLNATKLRRALRQVRGVGGRPAAPGSGLHRTQATRRIFLLAEQAAADRGQPMLTSAHLLRSCLDHPSPLVAGLIDLGEFSRRPGAKPDHQEPPTPNSPAQDGEDLAQVLKELRQKLLLHIVGQDQAVHSFVEGLFNAEVVAAADPERRRPKAIFVFAGPPGVGKTFLAESGAEALGRPFKRFDMSGYADDSGVAMLAGMQRSYKGAGPGQLTGFVQSNPDCLLLFDEIEKSDMGVIHLFLQLLDNGSLEDRFSEEHVAFKDAIIIFTTNAGRSLYDNPNSAGLPSTKSAFHRRTILSALELEVDPRNRRPSFPQAICSRLATGYPVMFNHLGLRELELISKHELDRMSGLLQKQYHMETVYGPELPLCLVLREGGRPDARTVRAQTEIFVKTELFKFFSLYKPERLKAILKQTRRMIYQVDTAETLPEEIADLMQPRIKPAILLAVRPEIASLWAERLIGLDLKPAADLSEARTLLSMHDFDFCLLDLWFDSPLDSNTNQAGPGVTAFMFDHVPIASRSIRHGQELLRWLNERHPELPCFLLSFPSESRGRPGLDDELLASSLRAGGARGSLETDFVDSSSPESAVAALNASILDLAVLIYRTRKAAEISRRGKILTFDTAPAVSPSGQDIMVRLRNLRTVQSPAAEDISEMISEADRPDTTFTDVYGAAQAKIELQYIVNWLKNPRQYAALELRPPKGILLFGPPGTGKTMLARALAGESDVAFIAESATNFVTKFVGSGPENVRNLFARARRYAPAILFIDEIDAIGRKRAGTMFNRPQEETLNSLLTEMDGFGATVTKPVIVLAATNLVETLDEALIRRFDREIEVDKPDRTDRAAFLRQRLQGRGSRRVSDEIIDRLAGQSANMTIAQLERIIQLAGRRAAATGGLITDELIEDAFETMRTGEAREATDPNTLLRIARHEAGHCLIGWLAGEKPVQVTIVARGQAGGFMESQAQENVMIYTRTQMENLIRKAMGGRAAEIVYYGPGGGLSTGVAGDLKQATRWASMMVKDYGMTDDFGPVAVDGSSLSDGPLAGMVMEASRKIIQSQQDLAVRQLKQYQVVLDSLVEALMIKNRLTGPELEALLGHLPTPARDSD
jgi:ATP-dependent metalloprotease FtsH